MDRQALELSRCKAELAVGIFQIVSFAWKALPYQGPWFQWES